MNSLNPYSSSAHVGTEMWLFFTYQASNDHAATLRIKWSNVVFPLGVIILAVQSSQYSCGAAETYRWLFLLHQKETPGDLVAA